jgi:HK97 gp10 family phage protein
MRIDLKGMDKLEKALKKNVTMNEVKMLVRKHGTQMNRNAQDKADFKGHMGYVKGQKGKQFIKPTGTTKRSIHLEFSDGGMTVDSGPTTHYAEYLEVGTRFMDAQPFMKPAYDEQKVKFKRDLKKLVR